MGAFEQFPYTNFHDLNLDWVLQTVKGNAAAVENYGKTVTEVKDILIAQGDVLQEAQTLADGAVLSKNAAKISEDNAKVSETNAAGSALDASGSATAAEAAYNSIGNAAESVINEAAQMDIVYSFFQSISANVSTNEDIQTAAEQIALAMADTLIVDGGEPETIAVNIIDGGIL